jgi:hypothetical protein
MPRLFLFPRKTMQLARILNENQQVCFVPRSIMRRRVTGNVFDLKLIQSFADLTPVVPASWDGSKGRKIVYPILGNDQYGCCYYSDAAHCDQTWTGNAGVESSFDATAVVSRYLQIAGGDNGLDDATIFQEWDGGIIGPNGPHKILDDMLVNPRDDVAIRMGMYLFCGASWTAALPNAWVQSAKPGAIWDKGTPNPANGHAMHLSGFDATYLNIETWGFNLPVKLTSAGRQSADPEVTLQFSLDMFDPATGIAPHNGMSYDELAALWAQLGGKTLPPNPFVVVPPVPPTPPTPPVPGAYDEIALFLGGVQKARYKLTSE